jgi:outer membrane protein TolC
MNRPASLSRLLFWLGLLLAAAMPATAAERPLLLSDAIGLALANHEGIVLEREALASAEAATTGAEGAYDPLLEAAAEWRQATLPGASSFSGAPAGRLAPSDEVTAASVGLAQLLPTGGTVAVRAGAGRRTTDATFDLLSPAYDSALGVELRQPLLRDRRVDAARTALRVAAADRSLAAAELHRQVADTVAATESAYWALVAARREVAVREEAVRLAQEQLSETDERIAVGHAPETEAAQPRAELERRRGELFAAREAVARADNALKLLVLGDADGAAWGDGLVPVADAEPTVTPLDVTALLDDALRRRPELAALAAVVDRRRAEAALATDALRPALDAIVSYDRYGLAGTRREAVGLPGGGGPPPALVGGWEDSLDVLGDGDLDDTRVALVFAVPLGNRRARAGAAIAESAERAARAEIALARKGVRAEVLDAAAAVETARQRIEAARAAREAAEVQLMAERERYGAGMSTNFLVLTRQNDLSRARLEEIAAQTDYRRAATALSRATGSLLDAHGIAVDGVDSPARERAAAAPPQEET